MKKSNLKWGIFLFLTFLCFAVNAQPEKGEREKPEASAPAPSPASEPQTKEPESNVDRKPAMGKAKGSTSVLEDALNAGNQNKNNNEEAADALDKINGVDKNGNKTGDDKGKVDKGGGDKGGNGKSGSGGNDTGNREPASAKGERGKP